MDKHNQRVDRMLIEAELRHSQREQALDSTYNRLQKRMDEIASEGSRWMFLLQLLIVGFFAALFAGGARSLLEWTLEEVRSWWAG